MPLGLPQSLPSGMMWSSPGCNLYRDDVRSLELDRSTAFLRVASTCAQVFFRDEALTSHALWVFSVGSLTYPREVEKGSLRVFSRKRSTSLSADGVTLMLPPE